MPSASSSNSIPKTFDGLSAMTLEVVSGLKTHGKSIRGLQNTASIVRKDLEAATADRKEWETSRNLLSNVLKPAFRTADAAGRRFIGVVKQVLGVHLGQHWNAGWEEAGFTRESIQTPPSLAGREALLADLAIYFEAHPAYESAEFSVSAARTGQLHAALVAARTAVENHPVRQKAARAASVKSAAALRKRVRTTMTELEIHLERDSPLWAAFGLTAPAFKSRRRSKKETASDAEQAPASGRSPAPVQDDLSLAK